MQTKKINKDFYLGQCVCLAVSACILWLVFDYTNLDLYLSSLWFDVKTVSWPYYNTFLTQKIGYLWVKAALAVYGITLLCVLLYARKKAFWQTRRKILIFLLLAMIVVPVEVAVLKDNFHKPRPEQIREFGGTMPHVKLHEFLPDQPKANNWPGGHASGGAALVSLYFAGNQVSKFWRRAGLATGIIMSQLMGFIQVMRGQHFFSHNLWSLWFAWLTILLLYFLVVQLPETRFAMKRTTAFTCREIEQTNI